MNCRKLMSVVEICGLKKAQVVVTIFEKQGCTLVAYIRVFGWLYKYINKMKGLKKMIWSEEVTKLKAQEIELLKRLRAEYGTNSWQRIANDINIIMNNESKKNGRQCREKYLNCCKFDEENK